MHKTSSALPFSKHHLAIEKGQDTHWPPNVDVYVTDARPPALVIKVELAGMQRENLELTVDGNKLRISGERPDGCRPPQCKFLAMEINYGAFERLIEVPEGCDLSKGKAIYQNGFLRIDVPFIDKSSGLRSITIDE